MTLESANALASTGVSWWHVLIARVVGLKLPHSDSSVQTARDEFSATR